MAASKDEEGDSDSAALFASLRARQAQLDDAKAQLDSRWRKAECDSAIRCVLDNWVRRLDVDWPYAALGTAQGGVYVADLASGKTLAKADGAHPSHLDGTSSEMRMLYGDFDGGGLTAIALRDGLVVSAGRDGGAKLWRVLQPADDYDSDSGGDGGHQIEPAGELEADGVVSSVLICGGDVWTASLDGTLRRWEVALSGGSCAAACVRTIRTKAPLLCVAACEARGLVACGDTSGAVRLYTVRRLSARDLSCSEPAQPRPNAPAPSPTPQPHPQRREAPNPPSHCGAADQG